jgi:hypothetical protein
MIITIINVLTRAHLLIYYLYSNSCVTPKMILDNNFQNIANMSHRPWESTFTNILLNLRTLITPLHQVRIVDVNTTVKDLFVNSLNNEKDNINLLSSTTDTPPLYINIDTRPKYSIQAAWLELMIVLCEPEIRGSNTLSEISEQSVMNNITYIISKLEGLINPGPYINEWIWCCKALKLYISSEMLRKLLYIPPTSETSSVSNPKLPINMISYFNLITLRESLSSLLDNWHALACLQDKFYDTNDNTAGEYDFSAIIIKNVTFHNIGYELISYDNTNPYTRGTSLNCRIYSGISVIPHSSLQLMNTLLRTYFKDTSARCEDFSENVLVMIQYYKVYLAIRDILTMSEINPVSKVRHRPNNYIPGVQTLQENLDCFMYFPNNFQRLNGKDNVVETLKSQLEEEQNITATHQRHLSDEQNKLTRIQTQLLSEINISMTLTEELALAKEQLASFESNLVIEKKLNYSLTNDNATLTSKVKPLEDVNTELTQEVAILKQSTESLLKVNGQLNNLVTQCGVLIKRLRYESIPWYKRCCAVCFIKCTNWCSDDN